MQRYRDRVSGPLLDRIDIHLEVPAIQYEDLASKALGESSAAIQERVTTARRRQQARFTAAGSRVTCNARMTSQLIKANCALDEAGAGLLRMAMESLNFSARAYDRILKVARTVADLAGAESIGPDHLSEAIHYRTLDRSQFG